MLWLECGDRLGSAVHLMPIVSNAIVSWGKRGSHEIQNYEYMILSDAARKYYSLWIVAVN